MDKQTFGTMFHDNKDGERENVLPRSVLRMLVKREEVPLCTIRFECKPHRHQAFDKWDGHILAQLRMKNLQGPGDLEFINLGKVNGCGEEVG